LTTQPELFGTDSRVRAKSSAAAALVPAYRYISRDYVLQEREKLWPQVWQVACRKEDLPAAGDYLEYLIGDQSILIVRSAPNRIQAFHNVCLHRGTRLKSGCGSATELRCMFHAWCWNLDGTNKEITDPHDFPGLKQSNLHLPEVKVGQWGGFVFINMNPDAEPLEDYLGPVPQLFARFRLEAMQVQSHRRAVIGANWKVPLDNFNESYHVVGLHPQQLPFIDDTNARYETAGMHSTEHCRSGITSARLNGNLDEDMVLDAMLDARRSTYHQGNEEKREQFSALNALAVPQGRTARDVVIELKRARLNAVGQETSGHPDSDLIDGHGLHLFPNVVMFMSYGEAFIVRTRPNGVDPDSCIAEIINLDFPAQNENRGRPAITHVPDADNHDWGLVIEQDLKCFKEVQAGMHSRGFPGIRLAGYQELRIRHMHENLQRYVGS
jgi:phenylpropionate dioxygenase-like ring-hydroxylating dioxygenase large terminal subunit